MADKRGKIIRILDTRTVIINLGRQEGITNDSAFRVHAAPEPIVDPETKQELGRVVLVKARLKAAQVYDRFTIAATSWKEPSFTIGESSSSFLDIFSTKLVDTGELKVLPEEVQPWKAVSEEPVRLGDVVQVEIPPTTPPPAKRTPQKRPATSSSSPTRKSTTARPR